MNAEELELLVHGGHGHPHAVLGPHTGGDGVTVRVFKPLAKTVTVVYGDAGRVELEHEYAGVWAGTLPVTDVPDYRVEVDYGHGAITRDDPYRFLPSLGEMDIHLINEGRHEQLWTVLGAHRHRYEGLGTAPIEGTSFAVWAPSAKGVRIKGDFNSWDGREHPMRQLGTSGIWELFVPDVGNGTKYKFLILGADGQWREKADPMAFHTETPPATSSVVFESSYTWGDDEWMAHRGDRPAVHGPMSVYEMHLGSWKKHWGGDSYSYQQIADDLVPYLVHLGFTHVEFLPVMEHPYGGSWGYQVTSYFAPTARFGDPDGFRYLVDKLHQAGIGVIVDWVPAHFPKDTFALSRFDGTPLYEDPNPRRGEHPDWGTFVFNFGRREVRNFLVANALYWLEEYHVDGLRVDAVASMIYLDYSREAGEWQPNVHGGRENLEAVQFLQEMNATVYKRVPGAITIAEESTSWDGGHPVDRLRRSGLRLQVEHGLDARHPRLLPAPARAPRLAPQRADLRPRLRLGRELRAAHQPRRGRARQGLTAAQDAGRPVAAAGQRARVPCVHVGAPRQAADLHGERARPGVRVGRGPGARLVAARALRAPRRARPDARPQPRVRRLPRYLVPRRRPGLVPVDQRQRRRPQRLLVRPLVPGTPPDLVCVANFAAMPHGDYRLGLPVDRHLGRGRQHRRRDVRRLRRRQPRLRSRPWRATTTASRRTRPWCCPRSPPCGSASALPLVEEVALATVSNLAHRAGHRAGRPPAGHRRICGCAVESALLVAWTAAPRPTLLAATRSANRIRPVTTTLTRAGLACLLTAAVLSVVPDTATAARQATCQGVPATLVGTDGDDDLVGRSGNDVIVAGLGDDKVNGGPGDDIVCGGEGGDDLKGGEGDDRLYGERDGKAKDRLWGD